MRFMKPIVVFFSALFLLTSFSCSSKEEDKEEKPDLSHLSWSNRAQDVEKVARELLNINTSSNAQWVSLFDRKSLDGWTVKCRAEDREKMFWSVVDGAIEANSLGDKEAEYVWLLTQHEYKDFVLKLKFQAFAEHGGNSGVQFRSRYDDDEGWLDGPQVDLAPETPWRTGMVYDETRENRRWIAPDVPIGSWVDTTMANPAHPFKFADEWNDLEITAVGDKVLVVLNGVTINASDMAGIFDDEFHTKYSVGMSGHIALQIHKRNEVKVKFKEIFVKEIK